MQAFLEENVTHSAKSIKAEQDIQVCIFLSCIPLQTLLHNTHKECTKIYQYLFVLAENFKSCQEDDFLGISCGLPR